MWSCVAKRPHMRQRKWLIQNYFRQNHRFGRVAHEIHKQPQWNVNDAVMYSLETWINTGFVCCMRLIAATRLLCPSSRFKVPQRPLSPVMALYPRRPPLPGLTRWRLPPMLLQLPQATSPTSRPLPRPPVWPALRLTQQLFQGVIRRLFRSAPRPSPSALQVLLLLTTSCCRCSRVHWRTVQSGTRAGSTTVLHGVYLVTRLSQWTPGNHSSKWPPFCAVFLWADWIHSFGHKSYSQSKQMSTNHKYSPSEDQMCATVWLVTKKMETCHTLSSHYKYHQQKSKNEHEKTLI